MNQRPVDLVRASAKAYGVRGPGPTGEFKLVCPFCPGKGYKADLQPKLNANPRAFNRKLKKWGPFWFCYRCSTKGSGDLSWLGPGMEADPDAPRPGDWSEPPPGFAPLDTRSTVLAPFVEYLEKRGVLEQALAVGTGACLRGKYGGRVVVPLMDGQKWLGFSARAIWPQVTPKYRFPTGMNRGAAIWGADWVPQLKDPAAPLWLVEGVFDALPLYPYGVATFGKSVTDEQLDLVASWGRPVCVALDGDAWQDCRALSMRLQMRGVDASWARLPPGEDPGRLGLRIRDYVSSP